MESAAVKTDEKRRRQWMNRSASLMHLSLDEWSRMLPDETAPAQGKPTTAVTAPAIQSSRPRHESGTMNKLEARYAGHLEVLKHVHEITDYRFEPMKLRLAKSTFFDVDFLVVKWQDIEGSNGTYAAELHEVKGHWEDDARVKMKVAAKEFPWWRFVGVHWDKEKKDWKFEEFRP
jgi:hypothetical protein